MNEVPLCATLGLRLDPCLNYPGQVRSHLTCIAEMRLSHTKFFQGRVAEVNSPTNVSIYP